MMQLEILTPDKSIFSGDVTLVKVPGSNGSFEILKNHAAIISTLTAGDVKAVTESGETVHFQITGGVAEVKKNRILILAEAIEK